MNHVRFLHCGSSLENYLKCLEYKVAGFTRKIKENPENTYIYFAVKVNGDSYCGARGVLGDLTDLKPWNDAERYVQSFKIHNLEYCKPFKVNAVLRKYLGPSWGMFMVGLQIIKQEETVALLEKEFNNSKSKKRISFSNEPQLNQAVSVIGEEDVPLEAEAETQEEALGCIQFYQTIKFKNEQDPQRGMEPLVNKYFYELFPFFKLDHSILIPENRLFATANVEDETFQIVAGTKGVPDALLLCFDQDDTKTPIRIILIEYECYGEAKAITSQKNAYFHQHVIPQLIRFASAFSVTYDKSAREKTIDEWIDKIMNFVNADPENSKKIAGWMRELNPKIATNSIDRTFEKELRRSFKANVKIILTIDELQPDQKEILRNMIQSFKLSLTPQKSKKSSSKTACGYPIEFSAYVVRLEQAIRDDGTAEYALSLQE